MNLKSLVSKMNPVTKTGLEAAAGLCMNLGHYNIEIEHLLAKLLGERDTDLLQILSQLSVNPDILMTEINQVNCSIR